MAALGKMGLFFTACNTVPETELVTSKDKVLTAALEVSLVDNFDLVSNLSHDYKGT